MSMTPWSDLSIILCKPVSSGNKVHAGACELAPVPMNGGKRL